MKKAPIFQPPFFPKKWGPIIKPKEQKRLPFSAAHSHTQLFITLPRDKIEHIIANFVQNLYAPYDLNMEPSEYER